VPALSAQDFEQFATTWDLLRDMNDQEATNVSELKDARAAAEAAQAELATQEAAAKDVLDQMAENKASIEGQLAERQSMLRGIESEIAALEAAERARAEAAARTAVSRASSSPRTFPAPTRAARSEVVSIAKRYLGAPYRWGASGPNSFDCSGFTMFVYSQVGVSLPHSSRAQINSGQRVSRADLQPGDLVKVDVTVAQAADALWLPPAAIRTFSGRSFVVVKDGESERRVDVSIGIEGLDRVEILEGLEENQVVVGQ